MGKLHITKEAYTQTGRILLSMLLFLAAMHVIAVFVDRQTATQWFKPLVSWFDLDREYVIPSVYTGALLACSSVVCLMLIPKQRPKPRQIVWYGLALVFLYLALDETFILHEQLAEPLRKTFAIGNGSLFYHAWVVPALAIVAVGGIGSFLAARHKLISWQQMVILSLLFLLIVLDIAIEAFGTRLYVSPLGYRLGAVMLEELYEIGMISYILYRLLGFARQQHANLALKQRARS